MKQLKSFDLMNAGLGLILLLMGLVLLFRETEERLVAFAFIGIGLLVFFASLLHRDDKKGPK